MATDKLRILATIPSGFCFGLQIGTLEFFKRFPENVESHFLLTRFGNGDMEKRLKELNIPFSYSWLGMFSRKLDWKNLKMSLHALIKLPRLYYDYTRLIKKLNPDILFFANHHELILLYPVLFFTKRKIVCHMHDPSPAIPFQKRTFRFYGKLVTRFMAITDSVRQRTIALGCPPEKIKTIRMSIAVSNEKKQPRQHMFCEKAGWPNEVFIIGITGQMTYTKGVTDLLEAFKNVHAKNKNARLVIGGKTGGECYDELIANVAAWELKEVVYFSGWLPEVSEFFKNIDVYVMASRHEEGLGLVVADAMNHYIPVVATASGGVMEMVENKVSGFVVEKSNPVQMADCLLELSNNPQLCESVIHAARKKIEDHFDIDKQAKAMVAYLQEVKNN